MDTTPADGVALRADVAVNKELLIDVGGVHRYTKATGRATAREWLVKEAIHQTLRQAQTTGAAKDFS